ncbi:YbaB/EbfC family nucleoid-associated protein [Glycomyces tenuis]|uniref:YbaB/EbfC family nucleoid-associated protein n=1 Tax=Glycomyces tenuis TaxID=58116 RepID=UPI00047CAFCC|nr:YbaB/EbfC family nucleoid-associated protein [Glycomyces tenuis]
MQSKIARVQRLALEAEAEVVSEDGSVRVVAGPGGQIKELDLRLKAFDLSGVELGALIVATMKAAMQQVERELSAEVNQVMASMTTNDEEAR